MKKSLLVLSAVALLGVSSASADFYGSLGVGSTVAGTYSFTNGDDDVAPGLAYSIAVGYELPIASLRAEVEYLRMESDMQDNGNEHLINQGIMLNGYVPLPIPLIKPYIGAGVGMMETSSYISDMNGSYGSEYNFAYQGIVGIELEVPVIKSIGIEARYMHVEADIMAVTVESDLFSLMLKARF